MHRQLSEGGSKAVVPLAEASTTCRDQRTSRLAVKGPLHARYVKVIFTYGDRRGPVRMGRRRRHPQPLARTRSGSSSTSTTERTLCSSSPRIARADDELVAVPVGEPNRIIHADVLRPKFYEYLR